MYSSNLVELCVLCIISVKHRSRGLHLASDAVERDLSVSLSLLLSLVTGHLLTSIWLREDYTVTAGFHTVYNLSVPNTYIRVRSWAASSSDSLQTSVPPLSATASEDKRRSMCRKRNKRFMINP